MGVKNAASQFVFSIKQVGIQIGGKGLTSLNGLSAVLSIQRAGSAKKKRRSPGKINQHRQVIRWIAAVPLIDQHIMPQHTHIGR